MKVIIHNLIGSTCMTWDEGQKVYEQIINALKKDEGVELNFEGVKIFASPFFNAAIGRLLKDYSSQQLNNLLRIEQLNSVGLGILREVIANSKEFYSKDGKKIQNIVKKNGKDGGR